jgi:hypothetical protein
MWLRKRSFDPEKFAKKQSASGEQPAVKRPA